MQMNNLCALQGLDITVGLAMHTRRTLYPNIYHLSKHLSERPSAPKPPPPRGVTGKFFRWGKVTFPDFPGVIIAFSR